MKYSDDIKPISYIKTHSASVLEQINETKRPIVITQNGVAKGVFIDTRSYEDMIDALNLMKLISQSENDIKSGKVKESVEVFSKLRRKIENE